MTKSIQSDLDRISRRGRRVFKPGFTLYYGSLPYSPKPRIVISSKIDKRSVVRHRIKRRIRHILQEVKPQNLGIVVIVNKQILDQDFPHLKSSLFSVVKSIV